MSATRPARLLTSVTLRLGSAISLRADATLLAQAVGVGIKRFIGQGHEVSIVHCHRTLALGCVSSSDRWSRLLSGAS